MGSNTPSILNCWMVYKNYCSSVSNSLTCVFLDASKTFWIQDQKYVCSNNFKKQLFGNSSFGVHTKFCTYFLVETSENDFWFWARSMYWTIHLNCRYIESGDEMKWIEEWWQFKRAGACCIFQEFRIILLRRNLYRFLGRLHLLLREKVPLFFD